MNRTLLLGAAVALAGLAVVFVPSLGAGVPLTYGTVLAVGGLALLLGMSRVRDRLGADRDTADLPSVEAPPDHPVPGDEFDADLAAISPRRDRENDAARAEVRIRLEAAALAVLARDGHPREAGRDMLDSGEWTDDPVAAAFFAAEPTAAPPDESLGERLRTSVAGGYSFDVRAKRAAYAIARRAGVDDATVTDGGIDEVGKDENRVGVAPVDEPDAASERGVDDE